MMVSKTRRMDLHGNEDGELDGEEGKKSATDLILENRLERVGNRLIFAREVDQPDNVLPTSSKTHSQHRNSTSVSTVCLFRRCTPSFEEKRQGR
jgi:hypothetical protein